MISPSLVQFVHQSGVGNMSETIRPPSGKASVLSSLEVHFTTGTLSADLTIDRDSRWGSSFDTVMHTVTDAGVGGEGDINFPVDETKLKDWIFGGDQGGADGIDAIVLNWTDPAGGTTKWGIIAGFIKVEDLP